MHSQASETVSYKVDVPSWPERIMKYIMMKFAELCTAYSVKNDLQAVLPSARQHWRT